MDWSQQSKAIRDDLRELSQISTFVSGNLRSAFDPNKPDSAPGYWAEIITEHEKASWGIGERVQKRLTEVLGMLAPVPGHIERAEYWSRASGLIETGTNLNIVIRLYAYDPAALATLRDKLPNHLLSQGQADQIENALKLIGEIEKMRSAETWQATNLYSNFTCGWIRLVTMFDQARKALDGDQSITSVIAWDGTPSTIRPDNT